MGKKNIYSITIQAPPERVFPYLEEGDKLTQWVGMMSKSESLTGDAPGVGHKFRDTYLMQGGKTMEAIGEIVGYEKDKFLKAEMICDGFDMVVEYHLRPENGQTRLDFHSESTYKGNWLVKLMAPLITMIAQRQLKKDLAKLKSLVEAG